jgi:hypothetical protein
LFRQEYRAGADDEPRAARKRLDELEGIGRRQRKLQNAEAAFDGGLHRALRCVGVGGAKDSRRALGPKSLYELVDHARA